MGWRSQPTGQLLSIFDQAEGCRSRTRIGEEGDGFRFAMAGLDGGRLNIAACSLGGAGLALEAAKAHLETRNQFGRPLKEFQALQFKMADMATDLEAARLMVRRAGLGPRAPSPLRRPSSAPWPSASPPTPAFPKIAGQPTCSCMGGYGYLKDYPLERIVRDLRVHQILEGTNEIMRVIISREMFRG